MLVRDDRTSVYKDSYIKLGINENSSLIGFQKISRKQNISVAIFLIRMQKKKRNTVKCLLCGVRMRDRSNRHRTKNDEQ